MNTSLGWARLFHFLFPGFPAICSFQEKLAPPFSAVLFSLSTSMPLLQIPFLGCPPSLPSLQGSNATASRKHTCLLSHGVGLAKCGFFHTSTATPRGPPGQGLCDSLSAPPPPIDLGKVELNPKPFPPSYAPYTLHFSLFFHQYWMRGQALS